MGSSSITGARRHDACKRKLWYQEQRVVPWCDGLAVSGERGDKRKTKESKRKERKQSKGALASPVLQRQRRNASSVGHAWRRVSACHDEVTETGSADGQLQGLAEDFRTEGSRRGGELSLDGVGLAARAGWGGGGGGGGGDLRAVRLGRGKRIGGERSRRVAGPPGCESGERSQLNSFVRRGGGARNWSVPVSRTKDLGTSAIPNGQST